MADPADPQAPVVLPRWQVQPWVIKASLAVSCLVALFAAFGAQPVENPPPATIYVPSTQPVDSLTTEDVDNLRAFVEQALEDDRLQRRTRHQLQAILDLLRGVEDGDVSLAPVDSGPSSTTGPPATPSPQPPSVSTTTTTSTPTSPPPPTTTRPPRPPLIDLDDLINDVLGS